MASVVVRECRGLIIEAPSAAAAVCGQRSRRGKAHAPPPPAASSADEAVIGEWRVVCMPFSKFFNYREKHASSIDWSTARVYEKVLSLPPYLSSFTSFTSSPPHLLTSSA